jgi:hypothetical protein
MAGMSAIVKQQNLITLIIPARRSPETSLTSFLFIVLPKNPRGLHSARRTSEEFRAERLMSDKLAIAGRRESKSYNYRGEQSA